MSEKRLEAKVAIVTGGGRGLGRAISLRLSREGAVIAVVSLHEETAKRTADEVERAGGRALALAADVADEEETVAYVEAVTREFGRVDILVNNAGVVALAPIVETSSDSWDRVLEVNL